MALSRPGVIFLLLGLALLINGIPLGWSAAAFGAIVLTASLAGGRQGNDTAVE